MTNLDTNRLANDDLFDDWGIRLVAALKPLYVVYEIISKKLASGDLSGEPIVVTESWLCKHKNELGITARKLRRTTSPARFARYPPTTHPDHTRPL